VRIGGREARWGERAGAEGPRRAAAGASKAARRAGTREGATPWGTPQPWPPSLECTAPCLRMASICSCFPLRFAGEMVRRVRPCGMARNWRFSRTSTRPSHIAWPGCMGSRWPMGAPAPALRARAAVPGAGATPARVVLSPKRARREPGVKELVPGEAREPGVRARCQRTRSGRGSGARFRPGRA
jgi:hypothetical protein